MQTVEKVFGALVTFCANLSCNEAFAKTRQFREYLAEAIKTDPKYRGKYFFDICSEEEFAQLELLIMNMGNRFPDSAMIFVARTGDRVDFPTGAKDPRN